MRDDRDFLEDILARIDLTREFIKDGREAFFSSRLIQEAVIRNLEIIGEASRQVSEEFAVNIQKFPGDKSQHFETLLSTVIGASNWNGYGKLL